MVLSNGFEAVPYDKMKDFFLEYLKDKENFPEINMNPGIVRDHKIFIESHLNVLDANRAKPNMTEKELRRRKLIAPTYNRLVVFYHIVTKLIAP